MYIVEVYAANASLKVNRTFSYYFEEPVKKHVRVLVDFNFAKILAFVDNCFEVESLKEYEQKVGYTLKPIFKVIDENPIVNEEIYELAKWLMKTTVSPFISCINTCLPKAEKTGKTLTSVVKTIYVRKTSLIPTKITPKQTEVYAQIRDGMTYSELRKINSTIPLKLLEMGFIEKYQEEREYKEISSFKDEFKVLNLEQETAYKNIIETNKLVSLLYGVTGSGKTEVYLHLARYYLSLNKQVLILVPEIALTPQMIARVKSRFDGVSFYHSNMSDQEKYEHYKRVINNEVNIVVGTRSAVFLPFSNLGLIIIDEEHDHSYCQDNTPCYKAKDVSIKRAINHQAKVLLASATPSVDTYARALNGDYNLVKLTKRINNTVPKINIIDTRNDYRKGNSSIISNTLKERISEELDKKHQIIILLNRRGYQPLVKCSECGEVIKCEHCDISLTYHKDTNKLVCHECGTIYSGVYSCKKCGSKTHIYYGYGTKKVEEELNLLFPQAKVERFDRDSTAKKNGHEEILTRFEKREIDILVGTQMIAKGLDYPYVSLVGILNADAGLNRSDYLASESTFDLLMQASGRSGRSEIEGEVYIQIYNADHYVLNSVMNQSYDEFYQQEIKYRTNLNYPPFRHILTFTLKDKNEKRLNKSLEIINSLLEEHSIKKLNPVKLLKTKDINRYKITILDKSLTNCLDVANAVTNKYLANTSVSDIVIHVDPKVIE